MGGTWFLVYWLCYFVVSVCFKYCCYLFAVVLWGFCLLLWLFVCFERCLVRWCFWVLMLIVCIVMLFCFELMFAGLDYDAYFVLFAVGYWCFVWIVLFLFVLDVTFRGFCLLTSVACV